MLSESDCCERLVDFFRSMKLPPVIPTAAGRMPYGIAFRVRGKRPEIVTAGALNERAAYTLSAFASAFLGIRDVRIERHGRADAEDCTGIRARRTR